MSKTLILLITFCCEFQHLLIKILRFHIDSTSIPLRVSLRIHFGLTSVSHRCHFDFASIALWHPLNPPQNTCKTNASGTIGTRSLQHQGNQRNLINPSEIRGKHINTHRNTSGNHQGSSTISQNHFSLDSNKGKHQTTSTKPQGPAATGLTPED